MHPYGAHQFMDVKFDLMVSTPIILNKDQIFLFPGLLPDLLG